MKALTFFVAILVCSSAYAAKPVPVTSYPPGWPHRSPWKLNRELLLPETKQIVFVVDTPRGAPPIAEALSQLATLASRYGGRRASWVRLGDAGAPSVRWVEPSVPGRPVNYYVRLRDGETVDDFHIPQDDIETLHLNMEIPSCPDGALAADISYVFVRYVGQLGNTYGNSEIVRSNASCGGREFPVIRVAQTKIAEVKPPILGQDFLEQRTLAHEYGHILGLGSNPSHGRWASTVPYRRGKHCTHRECAVSIPSAMALLKGQMADYCAACLRDIQEAREHWLTGKEFPEVPRLPQPDPVAAVARLRNYNFREGGEADKLIGFGKAVMPALVDRLAKLPGGSAAAPQNCAVVLAVKIVIAEDESRRPPEAPAPIVPNYSKDMTTEFLTWWHEESERFMGGDDWALPPMIRAPQVIK